ncbi:BnaAnng06550D [Brassica napus]|uniref:BnaAnng06550D protein n=1 Tax=Brassica napus TaxID=3708 RepID=A0A078HT80_BRANA|nr:BnaAnng06550D [Brassica napus]
MVNLEPRTECHPDNMAQVCKHCNYPKRLTQFVQFAMNQD